MPLTKLIEPNPARHYWCDLSQVVHVQYSPSAVPPNLVITLTSGQAIEVTGADQIAAVAKSLSITLPALIAP
jgi:hypothetical protein